VYEVKYFQVKKPYGYVVYEPSDSPLTNFIISIGPFIINTLLGALILLPASIELSVFGVLSGIQNSNITFGDVLRFLPTLVSCWLGISIIMHAFPSIGDAEVLVSTILKNKEVNLFIRIMIAPVVGFIYLGAIGSIVWLDLGYALLVAFFMPKIIGLFL